MGQVAGFPGAIWDGDSGNRDSDDAPQMSPDWRDWNRMVAEVAAAQTRVNNNASGIDDDTLDSVGTVATKTGLTVVEKGNGGIHKTILTMTEMSVATTDGSTPATDGAWFTQPLYVFPTGRIMLLGQHIQFPLGLLEAVTGGGTGLSDTADFEIGVGSVAAANASSFDLNAGDEEDIITAIVVALTGGTSAAIETGMGTGALAAIDGTGGSYTARLNMRTVDDADHGTVADALLCTGVCTFVWTMLGDD
jgi:hypothetical protein